MEVGLLVVRLILFAVFAVAGIGKLLDIKGAIKATENFGVPKVLAKVIGNALPFLELLLAFGLLFETTSRFAAIGLTSLLAVFIGGMLNQMRLGNAPECHCFGQFKSEPVSRKSVARNVVFAVMSLILVFAGGTGQQLSAVNWIGELTAAEKMFGVFGLVITVLSAVAIGFLSHILTLQKQLAGRIDQLDFISNEHNHGEHRDDVSHPADGLPIGAAAPDFTLPDVTGKQIEFEHLLMQTKPLLFFYVSPTCEPCNALLPEIDVWQTELKDKCTFVFISEGTPKDNIAKFGKDRIVLLQKDREVSKAFSAKWTPTAFLVQTDGTMASRLAAGDTAIRELIGELRLQKTISFATNTGSENQAEIRIGEELPQFSLKSLDGQTVEPHQLIGSKHLLTFFSLHCSFCQKMVDEIKDWEKIKGRDEPNLVLMSDGEIEAHKELGLSSTILIDKDNAISNQLGMNGTPSAILVDEHGKIVSETAIGADQIWSLIGFKKVK
jgi:peroxiredoxin/uncharacterized membrane protein YphA (DoxX/SURF4 family)